MKNIKGISIIVIVLAALVFVKVKFFTSNTSSAPASQGKSQATLVSAYVVKPERLDNKIFSTGTVLANEEVTLVPEVAGKIIAINFKEGSKVSKGDLLVKINDADLQAQLKKLLVQEKLAEDNEVREKKLLAANGISQAEYDAALAQLNSAKADVELTKAQIAKTEIHAPFDGRIGLKYVSEGSYVTPTALVSIKIATLEQIDPVKIDFAIPEKYSSLVSKGDSVYFSIQDLDDKNKFGGVIYAIEPKIDLATRTVQIRAICPNKEGKLFPGSFAKVQLILKQMPNSILIPTEALIPVLKGQMVYMCKNGKAQLQNVETGIRTDSQIEITKGLQTGDTVITTGIMQLKNNALVKIISSNQ